jgi:hypothetical protein
MTESELKLIQDAIGNGVILGVRYNGGSDPGSYREIQPNKLSGGMIWAFCHSSGAVKQFSLGKIISVKSVGSAIDKSQEWVKKEIKTEYFDMKSYFFDFKKKNNLDNDIIRFSEDGQNQNLEFFGRFKNGNMKKTPEISLHFEKFETIPIVTNDGEIGHEVGGLRSKPYVLRMRKKSTRSFARIYSAIDAFEAALCELQ